MCGWCHRGLILCGISTTDTTDAAPTDNIIFHQHIVSIHRRPPLASVLDVSAGSTLSVPFSHHYPGHSVFTNHCDEMDSPRGRKSRVSMFGARTSRMHLAPRCHRPNPCHLQRRRTPLMRMAHLQAKPIRLPLPLQWNDHTTRQSSLWQQSLKSRLQQKPRPYLGLQHRRLRRP